MCGVPIHAAEAYLARLIKAGHRVAIAEQIESPAEARKRGAKSVVNRAIVRVVTAGTLTEEALLDSRAANWLVAVARVGERYGLAAADVSTGRFELASIAARRARRRAGPARRRRADRARAAAGREAEIWTTGFDSIAAERRLKERFEVATLDGFGQFDRAALCAAGGLLAYLDEVARESLPFLRPPVARSSGDHMMIDAATRESLELTVSASGDPRRQPARRGRPQRHRRRRAAARRRSRRAVARPRPDRGAARSGRLVRRRCAACATGCAGSCAPCPTSAARSAGWSPGAGQPARPRPAPRRARRGAAAARPAGADWPSRRPCSPSCCRR